MHLLDRQRFRNVRGLLSVLLIAPALLLLAAPRPALAATVLLDEPFTGTTVNGSWTFGARGGSAAACLTAGGAFACGAATGGGSTGTLPDPAGAGTLRLTNNNTNQAGFALSNNAIPAGSGLDIRFESFAYGGNGADGINFFLIDGSFSPTTAGAFGGSLGYAQKTSNGAGPGLDGGYIGVGIDEYGNYANSGEGRGTGCTAPIGTAGSAGRVASGLSADYVTVRGAEFGLGTASPDPNRGYCYLASGQVGGSLDSPAPGATNRTAAVKHTVHITLSPQNVLTVEIDGTVILSGLDLDTVPGQPAFPTSFKLGFAGATGGSTNYHEIQNLKVLALNPDLSITKTHTGNFTGGQPGTYTLQVSNAPSAGPVQAPDPITVTDTLPTELTFVSATGTGWSCSAAGQVVTCSYTGTYPVASGATLPPITLTVDAADVGTTVVNSATVSTPNDATAANNTATDPTTIVGPTPLTLTYLGAVRQSGRVELVWRTSGELDTLGYHVYRSTTGQRADAERVTAQLIPAAGGLGSTYRWADPSAQQARSYTYWLQAVQSNGASREYGPIKAGAQANATYRILVPMVLR
jgi:uncharacterized repeat protein (TIGR01451 family)